MQDLVDVGGYRLSVTTFGSGDVPVVFVSGLGESGLVWGPAIMRLEQVSRRVIYDRAGIGDSEPRPPTRRTVDHLALADELAMLLGGIGVTTPRVLVGHSIGCSITRVYAGTRPNDVRGLVLVDASLPEVRLLESEQGVPLPDGDGPTATVFGTDAPGQVRAARPPEVPAVVVTRTPGREFWPKAPVWDDPSIDPRWQEAQRALADDLGAVQVIAAASGHRIQETEPELVAAAVDAVVAAGNDGDVRWADMIRDTLTRAGHRGIR